MSVGVLLPVFLVIAGCGGAGHNVRALQPASKASAGPSTVASPTGSTSVDDAARQSVLQAYFGLMGDWQSAAFNPADHGANLSRHASDQALALISGDIERSRRDGIVAKGHLKLAPSVTSLDLTAVPPAAQVDDCADTTDYLDFKASDGSPVSTKGGSRGGLQHVLAHIREVGGVWRVYDLHIYQVGSCR
ncbi:hypothetical protein [Catenulispora acidiphila]|uniref:hypothetical protein n=1 Tax=Catenulispora acidiphila TaxID=304895 RepID=UPI00019E2CE7|nr:hypothetical protein [Catenulispora acidiphila]